MRSCEDAQMRCWLLVAAVGCGGGSNTPDAMTDALGDHVEAIVMTTNAPEAGRIVSFTSASGTIDVETDADGRAVAPFTGSGKVELKNKYGTGGQTIMAVEAGDQLCFGACEPVVGPGQQTYVYASIDVEPYPGATEYAFSWDGSEYDAGQLECAAPCTDPIDIYAIAIDGNFKPLAWASISDVTVVPNSTITIPGPWHPAESFTLTVRNADTQIITDRTSPPSLFRFNNPFMGGVGTVTLTGPVANLRGMMRVTTRFEKSTNVIQIVDALIPSSPTYDLDASTQLLPWVTITSSGWTESAGQPYDAVYVSWQKSIGDSPQSSSVFAPAGTQISIPGAIDGASVTLIERSDMDYKELRQRDHRFIRERTKLPDGATLRWSSMSKAAPL